MNRLMVPFFLMVTPFTPILVHGAEESPLSDTHTNRLIHETSPYLLQHAHNPVDWFPWGGEAFEKARAEDKPIFLSIGYSSCHWCHVMERESFENEEIAAFLNEHFVSIKVDREERPDLDDIYMTAVTAMTGRGGWPMSLFLTPERKPFYGGTYFPPGDGMGRPGFMTVLRSIADAWENKRDEVEKGAAGLADHVREQMSAAVPASDVTPGLIAGAVAHWRDTFDAKEGGWGGAPKFPSSATIGLLLREYRRGGEKDLLHMATLTLDKMAMGGMYDHLGGGFHRYSTDAQWLVPHFEKMLYDNAQLSQVYLEAFQLTGAARYARVARETLDYELRDMRDPLGGFHSAEDADSEGEEGRFYVWTAGEIEQVLGREDAALFNRYYAVKPGGNFSSREAYHRGQNILHQEETPGAVAKALGMTVSALEEKMAPLRATLLEARSKRTRPGLDDKVLTSCNALLISSLAQASRILDAPRYRQAAEEAGRFIRERMMRDGVLLRTHRAGESRLEGYLDDYAFTVNAFVDLYEATFDPAWLREADVLAGKMRDRFWDEDNGTFFFSAAAQDDLLVRARPTYDGAEPSGNSVAAQALIRLGKLVGNEDYDAMARRVLEANAALMARAPQGFPRMLCAVDLLLHPPKEIAIAGKRGDDAVSAYLDALYTRFVPNKVVAFIDPAEGASDLPLLEDKAMLGGRTTVYICKDFTCERPITDLDQFKIRLDKAAR